MDPRNYCASHVASVGFLVSYLCTWALEGETEVGLGPLHFEIFGKKGCFLSFEWEKSNFTTSAPPWKNLGKIN